MLDIFKMKADCRPPISHRKGLKSDKTERVSIQMATPGSGKNPKRSINSSLREKENADSVDIFEEFRRSKESEIKNLKDILLSNLNLVEQQEKLLGMREKEIVQLKRENDTLRCRLERMERRMSLMRSPAVTSPMTSPPSAAKRDDAGKAIKRKSSLEPQSLAKKFATIARQEYEKDQLKGQVAGGGPGGAPCGRSSPEKPPSPRKHHHRHHWSRLKRRSFKHPLATQLGVAVAGVASPAKPGEGRGGPRGARQCSTPQKELHAGGAAASGDVTDSSLAAPTDAVHASAKKSKSRSGAARAESRVRTRSVRIPKDELILKTDLEYYVSQEAVEVETSEKKPTKEQVLVPSYRIKTYTPYYVIDGRENFEDEVYIERHKKPENEEKKRKRWDLQQQREEEQRRKLLTSQRYQKHHGASPPSVVGERRRNNHSAEVTSLVPDPSQIKYIEVCEELPVSVFGFPLPTAASQEFALPWFDMERRDKEEQKKTRGRKR